MLAQWSSNSVRTDGVSEASVLRRSYMGSFIWFVERALHCTATPCTWWWESSLGGGNPEPARTTKTGARHLATGPGNHVKITCDETARQGGGNARRDSARHPIHDSYSEGIFDALIIQTRPNRCRYLKGSSFSVPPLLQTSERLI